MKFLKMMLDAFKIDNQEKPLPDEKSKNDYDKYYENIRKQKENNLNISYKDMQAYNKKPFNLKKNYISDGNFTAIELSGKNLEIAYECLDKINSLISRYEILYENAKFPKKISTEYEMNKKLPISHLRLTPYTANMGKSKYPLCLWLSSHGYYGTEYLYIIYFDGDGNIKQCELSLHGSNRTKISYETKIKHDRSNLYVSKINKTLYSSPYGTKTIYRHGSNEPLTPEKLKAERKPKIDIEKFAKECNAYVIRKERNQQSDN